MTIIILVLVWCEILGVIFHFWLFDTIVLTEYKNWRDEWERDGQPTLLIRQLPDGCKPRNYKSAHEKLYFIWLFKTPSWALNDEKCRRLFLMYRMTVLSGEAIIILIAFLFFR
jgi:hypothetical protein